MVERQIRDKKLQLKCGRCVKTTSCVVATFNQEEALVGAFSVITNLRMELFEALVSSDAETEGDWRHHFTGEQVDLGIGGQIGGSDTNNCGVLIPMWQGWKERQQIVVSRYRGYT